MKGPSSFGLLALALAAGSTIAAASNSSTSTNTVALLANGDVDLGVYASAYAKAVEFVNELNNTQKISLISGTAVSGSNTTFNALTKRDGVSGMVYHFFCSRIDTAQCTGYDVG
jgi:hypothetical protein